MKFKEKNCASHAFNHGHSGHKCTKGKAQYIEVFSNNGEYEGGMDEEGKISDQEEEYETTTEEEKQEENQPSLDKEILEVLSVVPRYHTIRFKGVVLGQRDLVLVDEGATHKLIYEVIVEKSNINIEPFDGFTVVIPGHNTMQCKTWVPKLQVTIGNYNFVDSLYVVNVLIRMWFLECNGCIL